MKLDSNIRKGEYTYYELMVALYITIFLTTILLSRQLIQIHSFLFAGATITIPIGFFLGDVIAEVYGYYAARQLVWIFIVCSFVFSIILELSVYASAPSFWKLQNSYILVFGHSLQISFASAFGMIVGGNINAYALSKWKILLHGRFFLFRSLGASGIGEFVFVLIALPLSQYNNHMHWQDLIGMMMFSYSSKLLFSAMIAIPGSILTTVLKRVENVDREKTHFYFNPFVASLK